MLHITRNAETKFTLCAEHQRWRSSVVGPFYSFDCSRLDDMLNHFRIINFILVKMANADIETRPFSDQTNRTNEFLRNHFRIQDVTQVRKLNPNSTDKIM